MYISFAGPIFIIAVGAILRFATNFDISGIDMDVIGLILMIAGIAALLLSIGVAMFNNPTRVDRPADTRRRPPSDPPPPPRG